MATVASISSHTFDGSSTQGIVSIVLSATDFAKLDLSKLQLFSVDGLATETMASSEIVCAQTEVKTSRGAMAFGIVKSKGVVEAEKASAEHQLLKLGAVSSSPRARKKAVSMDEITLNENLGNFDTGASGNVTQQRNGGADIARSRVRARRQLPELELAALPPPGLEQRAETLRKKHFERVLSRTLSEIRSEEAAMDLKASCASKFLLQVMPWELTPPITPVSTPAGIPFMWEDVPGRPKPHALPSPSPSLPLPPRLLITPPAPSSSSACLSSDATEFFLQPVGGKQLSPAKSKPCHGRTHRKGMHSWHVLHTLFSGSYQRCSSHALDASLEAQTPVSELKTPNATTSETSRDGVSSGSTSVHSNSTSFDLSPNTTTASEDAFSSCGVSVGACYELPPISGAPVVLAAPPHRDLGPLDDGCGKQTDRLSYLARLFCLEKRQRSNISRTGSFFNSSSKHDKITSESNWYLLDDANGDQTRSRIGYGMHTDECRSKVRPEATSGTRTKGVSAQMSPVAARLYQSPKPSKPRILIGPGRMKVFLNLRRRGARVIVASYRAVKRALFLRRANHSRLFNHTQLPYRTLPR